MSRKPSSEHMPPPPPPSSLPRPDPASIVHHPQSTSHPLQTPVLSQSNDNQPKDFMDKYYKLKHLYWELQDKYKELQAEVHKSAERNRKLNDERGHLLNRIIELESSTPSTPAGAPGQPPSSAFPRALLAERTKHIITSSARGAVDQVLAEDTSALSLSAGRHSGPASRKRDRDEPVDNAQRPAAVQPRFQDEHPTPSKRRRTKGGAKGKDVIVPVQLPQPQAPPPKLDTTLVSTSGKRIRIKPPSDTGPHDHPPPQPQPHHHSQPQLLTDPHAIRDPHGHSVSPLSSVASPNGEYSVSSVPSSYFGSATITADPHHTSTPGHMQQYIQPDLPPHAQSSDSFHNTSSSGHSPSVASAPQRFAKPKRLKAHTVTSKSHSIPTVPRDKAGRPTLPLNVGIMTVISLGQVCLREHFHTERYIFPVGYEVTRRYLSAKDPNEEVTYRCTILDGGDAPQFQIIAADQPDKPIVAGTATGAWSVVVRAANHIRNRQHSNSVSGPDFFGLGQNTIKHLIQELPGAERLRDYVWQKFVEGGGDGRPLGGRHAAVVAATPDAGVEGVYDGELMSEREADDEPQRSPTSPYAHGPPSAHYTRSPPYYPPSANGAPPPSHAHYNAPPPAYPHAQYGAQARAYAEPADAYRRSPPPPSPAHHHTRSPSLHRAASPVEVVDARTHRRTSSEHRSPPEPAYRRTPPAGLAGLVHAYDAPPVQGRYARASDERDRGRGRSGSASGSSAGA